MCVLLFYMLGREAIFFTARVSNSKSISVQLRGEKEKRERKEESSMILVVNIYVHSVLMFCFACLSCVSSLYYASVHVILCEFPKSINRRSTFL